MRYLRMLSNSAAAGLLAACYVLTLVLQLNPAFPVSPSRVGPLVVSIGLFYAFHATVIFYVLLVLRQLTARALFSPAWLSVRVLAWLGAVASASGAALMWANLRTFGLVLDADAAGSLARGAFVLAGAAAVFLAVALVYGRTGERGHRGWGVVVGVMAVLSVAGPLALRGWRAPSLSPVRSTGGVLGIGPAEGHGRVVILAIDGASLDFVLGATAQGRLPNFGRMLDGGAAVRLATLHPTSSDTVWAAIATGKLPQKNGVRSAVRYHVARGDDPIALLPDHVFAHALVRSGRLLEEPNTSADLRAQPLWGLLTSVGASVGVVGWPLTHPAPSVNGYVVSDLYPRLAAMPSGIENPIALYPRDIEREASAALDAPADPPPSVTVSTGSRGATALQTDLAFERLAAALGTTRPARVTLMRYQSVDAVGHHFLRYATPSEFGDVTEDERRRFGQALSGHYVVVDDAIGRAMASLEAEDLLLVVSGYGMEPLGFVRRLIERLIGDPDLSGSHDGAPDGFLLAYGAAVEKGRRTGRASVLDVVPTVLYFLGLPVGRDMDGYARTDLFRRSFTDDRPITFIPTYDR